MMEKYNITIKKSAAREMKALPRQTLTAVLKNIAALSYNPCPKTHESIAQSLHYNRIRCGAYRVLYTVEKETCIVYALRSTNGKKQKKK